MAQTLASLSLSKVVCSVLLLCHVRSASVLYDLDITNDGPITTEAQATIHSTLRMKDGGNSPVSDRKYHFSWVYGPLILVESSEHGMDSTIIVTSPFPGVFPVSVQVMHTDCWLCQTIARNLTVLEVSEFIVGNLSITQTEDHDKLDSRSPTGALTRVSFLLHDPSNYFESASFTYKWDFGDGTEMTTEYPTVYHNYSTVGVCSVHLEVAAEWRQDGTRMEQRRKMVQKTGHFSAALELMDAVRGINIVGSTEAHVMENLNLSLHIQGSLPLHLCWLIKTECVPLDRDHCHLVAMNATHYNLSHVFRDAGQYCLSVRVENGVNMLQSYQEIQVRPSGIHPAFLALPCITLLSAMLGLAAYVTFRSSAQQKDLVEVADFDFSPTSDTSPSGSKWNCRQMCCETCCLWPSQESCETIREHHSLLRPLREPVKMYTM
ncbi:transmembrane protein 130 [Podarcis raffonei]|uniref:transmembrane protein 130 n=1 Tax=Podarcis raffonei TaxID=65483 RepID=UPI0023299B80|nr:transmembrane protein 130 [Podarcis raffonei]